MSKARSVAFLLFTAIVATGGLAGCGPREPAVLRFDGLYQAGPVTGDGATYWHYLRFYEDGTVLSVSSTGQPAKVARWFQKPYESGGQWAREDDRITFTVRGSAGNVDHEGEVLLDGLHLSIHSHINDHRREARYEFVELEASAAGP